MDKYPVSSAYKRDPISKNYNEIVFRPHPSQSSELNDLQLIVNHRLQSYIETMYKDGDVISGGYSNTSNGSVYFFDTIVYIRGQILTLPADSVQMKGVGNESIGILYKEEYITANEDIELLDPAINTSNYRKRGADRVRYKISWAVDPDLDDNSWFYPICEISEGTLSSVYRLPVDRSSLNSQIAEYDASTRGSYIVDGSELYYSTKTTEKYIIGITNGRIRISGEEISIPYNTSVNIRFANDTRSFTSEPVSYYSGITYYKSRHTPIKSIERVLAQQTVEEDITHRYYGSIDSLMYTPVIGINSITMPGKTFASGIDYKVTGDGIEWLTDNQPSAGSQYHIIYNYFTEITEKISFGKEYESDSIAKFIIPESAGIPNGTLVTIDYTIYLSRKDTISVSPSGVITVSEGFSSENSVNAGVAPSDNFVLGTVEVDPYGNEPVILLTNQRIVKVADQRQNILKLEECEYNISRLGLLMSLSAQQPSSILRSNFVDPLQNDTMIDRAISECSLSDGYLGMKVNWDQITMANLPFSAPYTEETVMEQLKSSKNRQVNEFLVFSGNTVSFSLNPSTYYFVVDYVRTNVYGSQNTSSTANEIATGIYDVPTHNINLSASGFESNESIKITALDSEYLVQADSSGNLSTSIQSPTMKSGTILISIEGMSSGLHASSSYIAQPIIQHQYVVTTPPPTVINYNTYNTYNISTTYVTNVTRATNNSDPLAQTFQLPESRDITSVDLYFTKKPTTNPYVMVTETTAGMPDPSKTLGVCTLKPSDINIDGSATTFRFESPLPTSSDSLYAVVVGCDDADARIKVAELGKIDTDSNQYITQNVYNNGTLLQASQLSTWTPIQAEDAKIRIKAAKYSSLKYSKNVGNISVSGVTDIMIFPVENIPQDSSVSVDATLVENGNSYNLNVASPLTIRHYTGDIDLTYNLESTSGKLSPIVYSCQVGIGKIVNPSYYISRAFSTGSGTKMFVYLTSLIPTGCHVYVYYQNDPTDLNAWTQLTTGDSRYPDMNMGNDWIERTYFTESFPNISLTRVKIELSTDDSSFRPYCVDLRAVFV